MNNTTFTIDEEKALTKLKDSLNEFLGDRIVGLIIYGSKARGDYGSESDIDIAIIIRELTRELKKQVFDIIVDIELEYLTPLSTLVLSEEHFEFLKKRERRIALDIEREGIPL